MQRGTTLVELMISLGITTIIAASIMTFILQQQKNASYFKYEIAMRELSYRILMATSQASAIACSTNKNCTLSPLTAGNQELYNCTHYDPAHPCTTTSPDKQMSFTLTLPRKNHTAQTIPPLHDIWQRTLAGSKITHPHFFSLHSSQACNYNRKYPSSNCQLQATAYFWAICPHTTTFTTSSTTTSTQSLDPLKITSCPIAKTINVRYQLQHQYQQAKQHQDSHSILIGRKLPSIPPNKLFNNNKAFGAIAIPVATISNSKYAHFNCQPNFVMVRITNGKPVCKCKYPYKLSTSATGMKVCLAEKKTMSKSSTLSWAG